MMEKMMGQGPMGDMMSGMMKNMQSIGPKDKMSMMFSMLEPAARKNLAEKMMEQMQEELKKQAGAQEGDLESDEQKSAS